MAIFGRKVMNNRITILGIVVLFLLSLDVARIFYLQVLKGDKYAAKAESQQLSDTEIPAMRGTIYDSDGNILAQSATVWTVYLDPLNIKEKQRPVLIAELTKLFDLDEEEAKALEEKTRQKNHYVIVREQVENNIKKQLADFIDKQAMANCIGMEQSTKRYYPYGSLASSVIGFTGADDQGLSGLEQNYNDLLTGTPGRLITAKDAKSNSISDDYSTSIAAQDGDSLILTINQTIQYYLEKGLRETMEQYRSKGAYGVVMDCNTGAVLAMSSMPDYDCNEPYKLTYDKNKKAIKKIKDKTKKSEAESAAVQNQWRNFTVSDTYVPGSVFKTFIASAALEEKVVNLNTSYTCTGSIQVEDYKMNCHYHAGHGTQNLTQGLENSCNPFFITIGQRLGVHNYFKYFQGFGFTDITGIDLPGEASPQYYKEKQYGIVELSSASFGQTNSLTPIQVCTGLCAVANGGTLLKPYVVSEVRDADGKVVQKNSRTAVRQVISEDTSKKVCKMMKAVVDEGTGKNGYVAGYRVGGKTGTSTKLGESAAGEKDKYIVSFAAIAPSDDPQIAMLIIVDEPNEDLGGGALCAPIASQVVEQAMTELGVEPVYTDSELSALSTAVPSVTGKTVEKAKSTLSEQKYKYKVVGSGKTVVAQSPSGNDVIPAGGTVWLYTESGKEKKVKVPNFTGCSVSEAKALAQAHNLNIEITGNDLSSGNVKAYRQSEKQGTMAAQGKVVVVSFKNTESVLD